MAANKNKTIGIQGVVTRKMSVYIAKSWDCEDGEELVFLDESTCIAFCISENTKTERYGWYEVGLYGLDPFANQG